MGQPSTSRTSKRSERLANALAREPHPDDWKPHPGAQERFLQLGCFEALYGGAAGGGKSTALLAAAAQFIGRGYGTNYKALLLRREFPDLEMSLMAEAFKMYPHMGGTWNGQKKTWTFRELEQIRFGHIQHEQDVYQYQGAEFQFIGFDELTTFTEKQYLYLFSRLRSTHGVPLRVRAATNPGGEGHEWVFHRWREWLDPKAENPAGPAELRYHLKDGDDEIIVPRGTLDGRGNAAQARTFVPARLEDNPSLYNDGRYVQNLENLDPVTFAQLRLGDWLIRPGAGVYFKRAQFKLIYGRAPANATRIRYWDRAATEESPENRNPDWTVGLLMARDDDKNLYVEDLIRFRGNPGDVEARVKQTAYADGPSIRIGIEQDPGSAGKFEAAYYIKALQGWDIRAYPATKAKEVRAGPISAQVNAGGGPDKTGNVSLVRAEWNEKFIQELEAFPTKGIHDDQVDAFSGAFAALVGMGEPAADAMPQPSGHPYEEGEAGFYGENPSDFAGDIVMADIQRMAEHLPVRGSGYDF